MHDTPAVPGTGWYIAAGGVAVATIAAIIALIAWFVLTFDQGEQFLGPGRHTVWFDKPGTYLVWIDYRTEFRGRSYHKSAALPSGVQVIVRNRDDGKALVVSASHGARSNLGISARKPFGKFEVARPGRYEILIQGEFPQRVFSVRREFLFGLLGVIFGAIGLLFAGFGAALGIVCRVFIRHEEARNALAPPGTGAATQSLKNITRIVYVLQLCSLLAGVTFIAAVVVNYISRGDAEGAWLASHFRWQIQTFWRGLLWSCVGFATLAIGVGVFVLMASTLWMLYRAIKGLINLEEMKSMGG